MTDAPDHSLERALEDVEQDIDATARAAAALTGRLRRLKRAVGLGTIRELEALLTEADQLTAATRDAAAAARGGWRFDVSTYLESGAYRREVVARARERGVRLQEQEDRIVSFPSLVRILSSEAAVEIDRKRRRDLRPSHLVEVLRAAQDRPARFRPEPFLEAALRAYRLVLADQGEDIGETVRLVDVYKVLTLRPGQATAYSLQEFGRDVHLLDESRVARTREGLQLSLPAASGTRTGSALPTVTKDGDVKVYYGIAFRR